MLQIIIATMFALLFSANVVEAQRSPSVADVDREASGFYSEMDSEVDKFETQQQAEFRLLVHRELMALEMELEQAYNDSLAEDIMGLVGKYTDELLAEDIVSPQIKTIQFGDFIQRAREITGLAPKKTMEEVGGLLDALAHKEGGPDYIPHRYFFIPNQLDLGTAYSKSDWVANTTGKKSVPKKWWKREGQTWTSKDGKVTFAVAKGQSTIIQFAYDKAELEARLLLVGANKSPVATLVGTQVIRWKSQKDVQYCLTVYCLMAVPKALLPKEVEK
ncbi:MAG: hypothetical protein Q8Q90_03035 [bacterium]|nr:hypothetical protein [bacterium]